MKKLFFKEFGKYQIQTAMRKMLKMRRNGAGTPWLTQFAQEPPPKDGERA